MHLPHGRIADPTPSVRRGGRTGLRRGRPDLATVFLLLAMLLVLAPSSGLNAQPSPSASAVPVGTVLAQSKPVAASLEFVGRIEAVARVDIRARITGWLQAVLFKEGSIVTKGEPLFRIERDSYEAAVQQAQGDFVKAQGQYDFAVVQRQRAEELVRTQSTPVATRDQRIAEEKTAQGQTLTAAAALRKAQIDLGYTEIDAPIDGQIGRTTFTAGNLVGPDSGILATIVSRDPMYATFPVSETEFLELRRRGRGTSDADRAGARVRLMFPDGTVYGHEGTINFVDVTVDRRTDTILVRASVPNPDGLLVDGQLVRVVVEQKTPEEKVLVPQAALIADQQGPYVFIVQDGKAEIRRLKLGPEKGPDVVVEQGLKGGEQVIVQGLQTLRPGALVTASPLAPPAGQAQ